jgi:uncharacterized protein (TIGR03437 family)
MQKSITEILRPMRIAHVCWIAVCTAFAAQAQSVVISQVYGGGGNVGATLRNDFVELFNRGTGAVNVSGWTVQYASASGSSWDRANLSGTIQASQYYLVQLAQGNSGTAALPTPDASGGLNLSATSGKVALVNNSTVLTGSSASGLQVVDFVGYGEANFAEGGPAPLLSNIASALRRSGGCDDSNDNQADFTSGQPSPRNSRSPIAPCFTAPTPQISAAGVTNAATFMAGAVAAGEIITIFGSTLGPERLVSLQLLPGGQSISKSVAGTRVLFDGVAAPIVYTIAGQVSTIVPYAVQGRRTTELQVEYNDRLSNRLTLDVVPAAPGIFTLDSSGRGAGAILNQDYQVNSVSTPAHRGSVVTLYATGGGQTNPPSEDGRIADAAAALLQDVNVQIGGRRAEVLYAGPAPGLVAGVMQINARVPESALGGIQSVQITVGNATSPPGVVLAIAGPMQQSGVGLEIETRLAQLRREPLPGPLREIPTDREPIPPDWLALVSWNIQVGGTSPTPGAERPPMVATALERMFSGSFQLLLAQEISNADNDEVLRTLLPAGPTSWKSSFVDSTDSMDNSFWYRSSVFVRDSFLLLTTDRRDSVGRVINDENRALHPPQVAQFEIGDFDFTAITLHLTFADGDTAESVRELRLILDYLDWYFNQPDHDPDVVVCGDFNIPSVLSGQTGRNGITLDEMFDRDPRFQSGERRFAITVHEPTSRSPISSGSGPARNYDHCVVSADTMEEFVQARRVSTNILTDHPNDPEVRLTSDHFPIVAFFKVRGEGISLDLRTRIRQN